MSAGAALTEENTMGSVPDTTPPPAANLGVASTRQLLDEVLARLEFTIIDPGPPARNASATPGYELIERGRFWLVCQHPELLDDRKLP